MNLQHLEYFILIADNKSMSKAAKECFVSQPALSRVIKSMEAEMRTQLFRRTAGGMELTKEGETLYGEAKRALKILNEAADMMRFRDTETDRLSVYSCIEASPLAAVDEFKKFNSSVDISYHLEKYDFDSFVYPCGRDEANTLFIMPEPDAADPGEDFDFARFRRMEAYVIVPKDHRLAERTEVRLDDLTGERFILPAKDSVYRRWSAKMFEMSGFDPIVEDEEICDEPMAQIDRCGIELTNVFYRHDIPLNVNTGIFNSEFRYGVMLKRNDVALVYLRGAGRTRESAKRLRLIAPGTVRWSWIVWPKGIKVSTTMEKFIKFLQDYYD